MNSIFQYEYLFCGFARQSKYDGTVFQIRNNYCKANHAIDNIYDIIGVIFMFSYTPVNLPERKKLPLKVLYIREVLTI